MLTMLLQTLRQIQHGPWRLLLAVLLAACASGASVALMGVSAWLISRAAEYPPVLYLQAAAVGVRAFGVGRGVFRYAERLVGHDLALRAQSLLRGRIYGRLARTTLIGQRHGDLLTRIVADVAAIQDLIVRVALPALSASLVIVGTTIILSTFHLGSALVLLATAVIAAVVAPWLAQRLSERADLAALSARGTLADSARELTLTAADLLANNATASALQHAVALDERLRRQEANASWVRGLATAVQILAAGVAVIAALWLGAQAVADGELLARNLAVLVLTPLALHEVFQDFAKAAQTHTRSKAAIARVQEVLDAAPIGTGDALPGTGVAVRMSDATVGWPGSAPVQTGVTLSIASGERVALVGPSGVGKTTIAATLMGLIPPLAGTVERAGRVGYLAQDAHIFATTVAENVRIGKKDASDEEIVAALRQAGLTLPLDRRIGEQGATLSGGERRRLALARVLVGDRDLLILDEPTEHLDVETATTLMRDVWAAAADHPALILTHDEDVIAACDRVIVLR